MTSLFFFFLVFLCFSHLDPKTFFFQTFKTFNQLLKQYLILVSHTSI